MRLLRSPIRLPLLASALVLASSCGERVASTPTPPADLFARPARPAMPAEAVTSEAAFEKWREDVGDWGELLNARLYAACKWFEGVGVKVECGPN